MPPRRTAKDKTTKDSPAKLAKRMSRRWRVVLLRHKGVILGTVEAPDVAAAKAAAAIQFELDDVQRDRDHCAGVGRSADWLKFKKPGRAGREAGGGGGVGR